MAEEPDSSCDDNTKTGYVRIRIQIPGLQPIPQKKPKNAEIKEDYTERSYSIKIECEGTRYEKTKEWNDIPFDIVPGQCFFEVERNFIHVFLKKKNPRESAADYCRNHDLD